MSDLGNETVELNVFCSETLGTFPEECVSHPPSTPSSCKEAQALTWVLVNKHNAETFP